MSAYVVTRDGRILEYRRVYPNKLLSMLDMGSYWLIYQYTCGCNDCAKEDHRYWIGQVEKAGIVSIGWERPICVEGRLLTASEKDNLTNIKTWLEHRKEKGTLPWKVGRNLDVLAKVAK